MEPTTTLPAARLGLILLVSGAVAVITGVVLLLLAPIWAALIAFVIGATDLTLGLLYRTGRLGPSVPQAAEAAQETAPAEPDPSYNPYARED